MSVFALLFFTPEVKDLICFIQMFAHISCMKILCEVLLILLLKVWRLSALNGGKWINFME